MLKIAKPDSESENDGDDVPLSNVVAKKWSKCLEKPALKKCSLEEEGIVNINLENHLFKILVKRMV